MSGVTTSKIFFACGLSRPAAVNNGTTTSSGPYMLSRSTHCCVNSSPAKRTIAFAISLHSVSCKSVGLIRTSAVHDVIYATSILTVINLYFVLPSNGQISVSSFRASLSRSRKTR
jgi:hypothetical protein